MKTCKAAKPDGTRCRAPAILGSSFCFFHEPSKSAERHEAQVLGGRNGHIKTLDISAPDVQVKDCGDVVALMSETINQVRRGLIDPRIGNAVGYLATVLIRAVEREGLETRIAELEAAVKSRSQTSELLLTEDHA